MFVVSIFVNIGMWFERFVIIVTSLHRDFLPSRVGLLHADAGSTSARSLGSFGLFFTLFLLFIRFLPMIAMAEVKARHAQRRTRATPPRPRAPPTPRRCATSAPAREDAAATVAARRAAGVLAEFDTPDALVHAARRSATPATRSWDAHTPFPVHGLDEAMGIQPTQPAVDRPRLRPHRAPRSRSAPAVVDERRRLPARRSAASRSAACPANIPVTFELTMLLRRVRRRSSGCSRFNQLPRFHHPLFTSRALPPRRPTTRSSSRSRPRDPQFDARDDRRAARRRLGGTHVETARGLTPCRRWLVPRCRR